MKSLRTRSALLACAALALALAAATPAQASHQNTASSGHLYTGNWNVCNAGVTAGVSATSWAMGQIGATDVNTTAVGCPGSWNVSVQSLSYPDTWYGLTSCNSAVSGTTCTTSKYVRLNSRTITTTQQWRKTALHELGHVGGLGHRTVNASVMTQGASPPVSQFLDSHDVASLNAQY
jgi:hypothetical protein